MPRALKIAAAIIALSLLVPMAAAFSENLLVLVLVSVLALFPGKDPRKPRLFKLTPYLWALSFLAAAALLVARMLGKELIPNDGTATPVTTVELVGTIVVTPFLLRALLLRKKFFPYVLIASSIATIALAIHGFGTGARGTKELVDLVAEIATEALLSGYLVIKYPAYARNPGSADPASP